MAKILLSGNLMTEDLACFAGPEPMTFLRHPGMGSRIDAEVFAADARRADLVLFRLAGQNPAEWVNWAMERPALRHVLESRSLPKVLWTQDSHRFWREERKVQHLFHRYYVAHSRWLDRFDGVEARWLPVAYGAGSIRDLIELRRAQVAPLRDAGAAYDFDPVQGRDEVFLRMHRRLEAMGVEHLFGRFHGARRGWGPFGQMKWLLKTSRIGLNASVAGELNLRCFETWAMDRPLVTDRVEEMARLPERLRLWTFTFDRCTLEGFDDAVRAALAVETGKVASSSAVLAEHTRLHRYAEIVRHELGVDVRINPDAVSPGEIRRPRDRAIRESRSVRVYRERDLVEAACRARQRTGCPQGGEA